MNSVGGPDFSCHVEPEPPRLSCIATAPRVFEHLEAFSLEDPDRLVVDIPGFKLRRMQVYTITDSPVIRRLRSGYQEKSARVVLDLKGPCSITRHLSDDKRTATFELAPLSSPPPSPAGDPLTEGIPKPNLPTRASDTLGRGKPVLPGPRAAIDAPTSRSAAIKSPSVDTSGTLDEPSKASDNESDYQRDSSVGIEPQLPSVNVSIPKKSINPDTILKFGVDSTFVSFEPGDRAVRDVQVINKTDQELFLRSDVQKVTNSGTPEEQYEKTKRVIATPRRFSLPPLERRLVRVLVAGELPSSGEEIYRLIISPEQMPNPDLEVKGTINQQPASFKVVAGLGVTIALPSRDAKGLLRIEPKINQVELSNSGTRAVLIESCSTCPLSKDQCVSTGRKVLYPNRPWSLPIIGSGVVTCEYTIGKESHKISSFYGTKEPQQ